jgi:BolA protein
MTRADRIRQLLHDTLAPDYLEVIDESARHAGHAGAAPGGETHFRLIITAQSLKGLSRLDSHRKVYEILNLELQSGLHALALELRH